jgi:transposase
MLAEQTDYVIGVDTHRDRHSAAILAASGGLVEQTSAGADRAGYTTLLRWAHRHASERRVWAFEGAGSYGAGLAAFLDRRGERVVEIGRRVRRSGPSRAKTDPLDAIEAAREALTQPRPAAPRAAGDRGRSACWSTLAKELCSRVWPRSTSSVRSSLPRRSRYEKVCAT